MANKKTISELEAHNERLFRRLNDTLRRINENRELIKKIRRNQVKQPIPAGKKVSLIEKADWGAVADFDDVIPSFGNNPAIGG